MTTEAKIRNGIHVFLGAVFAYCGLSATIIQMNEVQTFLIKCIVGTVIGLLIGTGIEIYQNWFLGQKYDNADIKRTGVGGLVGGVVCLAFPNVHFITSWFFWFALFICVIEIIRSQIAKIKILRK